ncbi:toxic anion resistance protein [Halomonas campisalis]|uniref:Toxic anion resistance protein n=1 Tax=Billgrantia campisalis TaxID=74661 RepID=A0ABS9PD67_9GAMM|nr:toxic anion resistance protein [Halomonas campisalis]MCG6659703.1 toxic anion resistance protein [Halomonas campisalis]MDR5864663.1 toxic anion resistance protein [Halomonas campisalis]
MNQQSDKGSRLSLPPVEEIARQLVETAPEAEEHDEAVNHDPELVAMAEAFADEVLAGAEDAATLAQQRRAVDEMGLELQQQAAHQSAMLQTPLRKLAHHGDDGGPVAQALVDLRGKMQALDPRQHRLSTGRLDRVLAKIPGAGSRLQRYFRKFENAQQALDAIIADLEAGRDMLHRDNLTLGDDQEALREILAGLNRQIALGRLIDRRLHQAVSRLDDDSPRRRFIEEELLFPLRQRIVDLQQQVAVSQQGVLALEVIIRNNRELMRGVDRAIHVTVSALTVAIAVALALANQRLVLDRVESLNATTSEMIAGTAKALRHQGVEIQTRASSALLDMQSLEEAFGDVMAAIDDLSRYRQEALPQLDDQINRLGTLARQGGEAIERLQRGSEAQPEEPPGGRSATPDGRGERG